MPLLGAHFTSVIKRGCIFSHRGDNFLTSAEMRHGVLAHVDAFVLILAACV